MDVLSILAIVVCVFVMLRVIEYIKHKHMNAGLVQVQASDLATYYVKNLQNKTQAADLLARTRQKLFRVVDHLRTMPQSEIPPSLRNGIQRIIRKHCHTIQLNELDASTSKTVAMNRNKGREIHICLRQCADCVELTEEDRLFVVALHELAHSATSGYDPNVNGITQHGNEFKRYEFYLIQIARAMQLVNPDAVFGKSFCGVLIPSVSNPAE